MKFCTGCTTEKQDDDFHKRAASKDGLSAKCRPCQSEYDKARANSPHRIKARKDYAKTPGGIAAGSAAKKAWSHRNKGQEVSRTRGYRLANPKKQLAHELVAYQIRLGHLKREPCETCGSGFSVHAHHDDYDKPLDVRWLCSKHHRQWHVENGPGINAEVQQTEGVTHDSNNL